MRKGKEAYKMKKLTLREMYSACGTLENLAEILSVGRNSAQGWLSGTIMPSWRSILKLRDAGVDVTNFPD